MSEEDQNTENPPEKKRNPIASIAVVILGLGSAVWLFAPIPDPTDLFQGIPFLANLDEAAATATLISCLAYFGLDLGAFFGRKKNEEKEAKGEVIDT